MGKAKEGVFFISTKKAMTAIIQPLTIHEFGDNLQQYNLDFEKMVIHSQVKEFEKKVDNSGLSIKLSLKGKEHYTINKETFTITPGNYLLVNKHQQFDCHVHAKEATEGFCIYLKMDLVREVYADIYKTSQAKLDSPTHIPIQQLTFLEKIYALGENELGLYLQQFVHHFREHGHEVALQTDSFYYNLAEKLLQSQLHINQQINQLSSSKKATREELFLRLSQCRNFIFDNFTAPIQLDDLSRVALLSKYHLLRTYKQVFGITPYQQVLQLRLQKAKELVLQDYSLEEVAFQLGFSDRRSFTKAFKKEFLVSPTGFKREQFPPELSIKTRPNQ